MARTKIFISSVNEDGLKPLRRSVFRELESLGHEPVMWEENLGPWPAHVDPVVRCLEAVEQCDIYLLFIGDKAGTYHDKASRTITHMEFIKAHEEEKSILVFGDVEIKAAFFSKVRPLLEQFIDGYISKEDRFPSPSHMMEMLRNDDRVPKNIDPYVWFLLYDMMLRKVYIDDLSIGVMIDWKTYFSDLLRRGSLLLPLEESIEQNAERLDQFDEAFELLTGLMPQLQITGFRQAQKFLELMISRLPGGMIEQQYGQYMSESVGHYDDCCAATLYELRDNGLNFVAKAGTAASVPIFMLDDKSSYAVLTLELGDPGEQVFFKEAKNMIYHCIRSGNYVITLHYPADPDWNYKKFIHYKESVNHAIMSKNPLIIEFIKLCLGGMHP
ncbi:uncharacterized protein DUF4062 [Fontibacillus phaseoli]|uniref:Uncharacterized protein DUF4062 n=1 Tax=Fontibacillus phaseoli TaxID=1416533 RepID=A0A369B638_9BACL|nr:DUF4062 domain-containing protein [Fontibacillus phaseoli]RCX16982.1 uncharacterized protein DUF4062 [Fontibacillus phaseoli]